MSRFETRDRARTTQNEGPQAASQAVLQTQVTWREWLGQRTWPVAMLAALGSFLALPPVGWWPLVFLAPAPWLWLARAPKLPGSHPYRALWLSGLAFWMGTLHWLRLPHPATSIGWVALAAYLACYIPALVALVRVAVHRYRVPLALAAPVVWLGLELLRGHLLTGFTMASLGHAPYRWLEFIQIADLCGAYGVSAAVMFFAAIVARMVPCDGEQLSWKPIVPGAIVLGLILGYGYARTAQSPTRPGPKVALIQGSIDPSLKHDPEKQAEVSRHYYDLSVQAVAQDADLDLLVWPETMYRGMLLERAPGSPPPEQFSEEQYERRLEQSRAAISSLARNLNVPLLLGVDTFEVNGEEHRSFNSALFVERDGPLGTRYDKMHPVLFGEYIPFGKQFPWLYRLTPLGGGLTAGETPQYGRAAGAVIAPNVCYETVVPHVICRQVRELASAGHEPDVLVNITNDGWYLGSSALDLHLMCGVFRAVECRKPLLIAANTGFSASIDSNGRILAQGPRRATGIIVANTLLDDRESPYLLWGDYPAGACLALCALLAVQGLRRRNDEFLNLNVESNPND